MSTSAPRKFRPVNLRPHEAQAAVRGELRLIVRVVSQQPPAGHVFVGWSETDYAVWSKCDARLIDAFSTRCPLGRPGDGLWGRETWRVRGGREHEYLQEPRSVMYRATHIADGAPLTWESYKWRPSILMPRWASRWSGVVEAVECRRVQTITESEAFAWGLDIEDEHASWFSEGENLQSAGSPMSAERYALMRLWQSMHGRDAWDANPWCWFVWVQSTKGSCDP